MGWYRSHGRLWSMAALLALTLQIALAFGHGHGFDAHPATPAAIAGTGDASAPVLPGGTDQDYCATCAILALLTGAQIGNAPVVAPPAIVIAAEVVFASETPRISASRASFRSRAPPLS
jgi:hypothetical protein